MRKLFKLLIRFVKVVIEGVVEDVVEDVVENVVEDVVREVVEVIVEVAFGVKSGLCAHVHSQDLFFLLFTFIIEVILSYLSSDTRVTDKKVSVWNNYSMILQ